MEGLPIEVAGVRVEAVGAAGLRVTDTNTGEFVEQQITVPDVDVEAWIRALPGLLAGMMERLNVRCLPPECLTGPAELFTEPAALDMARADSIVRETAERVGLGAHADSLVALRRTGVALEPGGSSQLGGLPLLPPGAPWPERLGVPMTLLAQIDLTRAALFDDGAVLPNGRLLQIFADLDGAEPWDDSSAVHVAVRHGEALVETPPPAQASVLPVREVTMAADALSVPPLASPFYDELPRSPLLDFLNDLHPPLNDDDRPRHRLLGYPDTFQNDPWEHLDGPGPTWQLLAQIDSEPGAVLGDNGLICVFLPANGDLTCARGVWQMH